MRTFNYDNLLDKSVVTSVKAALIEDVEDGDITSLLIPKEKSARAIVISREKAVVCGQSWVNEVFRTLDPDYQIEWHLKDGDNVLPDQKIFTVSGNARSLLTAERTALNFLQVLSATATISRTYSKLLPNKTMKILDTRKTIPGLRLAQKYAVTIGGCSNHRVGLYDAFLIKENHISACGSIELAVSKARKLRPNKQIEVEVETIDEFNRALSAKADVIMLDNFSETDYQAIEKIDLGNTKLEASGNLDEKNISKFTKYKIDYLSSGSLTKNIKAIDLSMRFV